MSKHGIAKTNKKLELNRTTMRVLASAGADSEHGVLAFKSNESKADNSNESSAAPDPWVCLIPQK